MSDSFKLYLIKCKPTNKVYVGYTASDNKTYNPVSYLNSLYKRDNTKYQGLGESIKEHGFKEHGFTIVKEGLSKDKAVEYSTTMKEKLGDRCLNDAVPVCTVTFDEELELLNW